jgi:hypothetical protein
MLFGVFVGIIGSTFDMPLRVNKLLFSMLIGVTGSLIGGMTAYFLYGIEVGGINVATLFVVLFAAVAAVLLLRLSGKQITFRWKGGETTDERAYI